jgi:ATP-binding cassette subfamily F protein uup
MDKVVDHIFEYKGDGIIKDFPGNYSQLREKQKETEKQLSIVSTSKTSISDESSEAPVKKEKKQGLTFKEKREFELLSNEIENLETEKKLIESELSKGLLNNEELLSKSRRHGEIVTLLDEKEFRWLELSEK